MIGRSLRTLGVAVAALLATALVPAPAQAAYTPAGLCGAGYTVKHTLKLPGATFYHLASGRWQCAVTIKTTHLGKATYVGAGLLVRGGGWALDDGTYRYYAGPVKQKGACASVRGLSGTTARSITC